MDPVWIQICQDNASLNLAEIQIQLDLNILHPMYPDFKAALHTCAMVGKLRPHW